MKTLFKATPLVLLALFLSSCGGGGAGTPEGIGESVVDAIQGENFEDLFGLLPDWRQDAAEQGREHGLWKLEKGLVTWKDDLKPMYNGDESLDPKSKAGIDDEGKLKEMTAEIDFALSSGCFTLYAVDKFEARVKEAKFWLVQRTVNLEVEGQGLATLHYENKYGDRITVTEKRENGTWTLNKVSVNFEKELPAPSKDESKPSEEE